jgi:hypothetical protein
VKQFPQPDPAWPDWKLRMWLAGLKRFQAEEKVREIRKTFRVVAGLDFDERTA